MADDLRSDETESYESPRKADVLFRDDLPDGLNNACLNVRPDGDHRAYTEGYLRGGRYLVERLVADQRDQDYLVYPIIFLYRHHVELVFKRLILAAVHVAGRNLSETEKHHLGTHRLDLLWADLKPLLSEAFTSAGWPDIEAKDIEGIAAYVHQLAALDPDSFSFRYASSKAGQPSLPANLKRINVRHFAEMMERLAACLDGLDSATSYLEDMEAEWRSEMASYMDWG